MNSDFKSFGLIHRVDPAVLLAPWERMSLPSQTRGSNPRRLITTRSPPLISEVIPRMFLPRQKVVCVDDVFPEAIKKFYWKLPVKGVTYTRSEEHTSELQSL